MRTAALTSLLAAAVALGGCGGPDVDLGAGQGLVTASGDLDPASAIVCREVARRFDEIQAEAPQTFEQAGVLVTALIEAAWAGEEVLRTLDVPAGRARAFDLYLEGREEVITQLERARDAAEAEDGGAYERAREAASEGRWRRFRLAVRAGLDGCAKVERG